MIIFEIAGGIVLAYYILFERETLIRLIKSTVSLLANALMFALGISFISWGLYAVFGGN